VRKQNPVNLEAKPKWNREMEWNGMEWNEGKKGYSVLFSNQKANNQNENENEMK